MVEVAGMEGNRRRLPPWMQGKGSTPGSDLDKNDKVVKVGDELVSGNSKPNKQSKKASLPVEKGETKRRKRKISQQDEPCDSGTASPEKLCIGIQEKQVREPSHQRKRKAVRSRSGKDSKTPSPVEDDEEEELTPDDLLSIAEEYVKADKDEGLQEPSYRVCEYGSRLSTISSRKIESGSSLIAVDGGNRKSPAAAATEETCNSTKSPKDDKDLIITNKTGDPAQDMLDLFLGPLLKKTAEEKKSEFIKRDLVFSNELGTGSQNDVKEETVPLTKKKGSLRDKVAMLLD